MIIRLQKYEKYFISSYFSQNKLLNDKKNSKNRQFGYKQHKNTIKNQFVYNICFILMFLRIYAYIFHMCVGTRNIFSKINTKKVWSM